MKQTGGGVVGKKEKERKSCIGWVTAFFIEKDVKYIYFLNKG
ncbi:MAG TPA: hypothetical protein VIK20_02995 [Bacteroidales bacterium]